jgi:hypothetical protein
MSNIALFSGSNVPAFVKNRELSATAKALAGGGGAGGKRISIKGGVFRLVHGGKEIASIEERYLDVVLVKAAEKNSRVFYAKSYDADAISAPDCWSQDGETPAKDAANPQAKRCADCPQNIAGSGQGQSRACRYQRRLAVVLENDMEGDVMQLTVPAASIFGKAEGDNRPLQAYVQDLVARGGDPELVVTRLKFDTKAESPKLFFKAMRWLTDDEYEIAQRQAGTEDAKQAITMTVAKMDGVVAEPAPLEGKKPAKAKAKPTVEEDEEEEAPAPKAKAKPAPAPVVEDDDEEEAPKPKAKAKPVVEESDEDEEPVVRKEAPKKPTVGGKASLAELADAWDDE